MDNSTFCILPFTHLEARADGFVAPCCMSQEFYQHDSGRVFHLAQDTLSDVWASRSLASLRYNLMSGVKDSKCRSCWSEESVGKRSKRLRENDRWQVSLQRISQDATKLMTPEFLDLKLGNACNLKCRICGPASSSGWIKEWSEINGDDQLTGMGKTVQGDRRTIMSWPDLNERFWSDLEEWLPNVKLFEIYGGEPFLIKRHFDVLKRSVELGFSKSQSIHYNTNGTIYPERAVQEIWPHFKRVDIMLSIDGIGEQFEYQRHPAKWIDAEKNMFRFLETFSPKDLHICLTVSALNAYYLGDYLMYFHKIGIPVWLNVLYGPNYFAVSNLPDCAKTAVLDAWSRIGEEKSILLESLDPIRNILMQPSDPLARSNLVPSIQKHDAYRGESYQKVFSEFARYLFT